MVYFGKSEGLQATIQTVSTFTERVSQELGEFRAAIPERKVQPFLRRSFHFARDMSELQSKAERYLLSCPPQRISLYGNVNSEGVELSFPGDELNQAILMLELAGRSAHLCAEDFHKIYCGAVDSLDVDRVSRKGGNDFVAVHTDNDIDVFKVHRNGGVNFGHITNVKTIGELIRVAGVILVENSESYPVKETVLPVVGDYIKNGGLD